MPQFDTATFLPQIFWMGVCLLSLYLLVAFFIVPYFQRIKNLRMNQIESLLEKADHFRVEGELIAQKIQDKIHEAHLLGEDYVEKEITVCRAQITAREVAAGNKCKEKLEAVRSKIARDVEDRKEQVEEAVYTLAVSLIEKLPNFPLVPAKLRSLTQKIGEKRDA